ncbi:neurotactin [Bacillus rossius redtenbacheri]|uniref:neurotactin n=1 Tax=Bacillus rossius redtenbacheri TaxID=93214 RepID=UPI002FDCF085
MSEPEKSEKSEKSEDKQEIEQEERDKILNEENRREQDGPEGQGEVQKMRKALEECEQDRDSKRRPPIGGIKMPGFLKSRSRDKCKDEDQDVEEGKDLLQDSSVPAVTTAHGKERDDKGAAGSRKPLLASIMINNPFGKKNKDGEQGGAAGLASMETLDDSSVLEKAGDQGDDGMESVKLDSDDKLDVEKGDPGDGAQKPFWPVRFDVRNKFHLIICAAVVFFVLLVVVVAVAASGQQRTWPAPLDTSPFATAYTTCGPVQGWAEGGAYVFRNIPYAAPPVGERRFLPAQPLDDIRYCWNGTLATHAPPKPCLQALANGSLHGSEDCLTLDVFTPRVGFENPVPVVVLVAADTLARGSPVDTPAPGLVRARDVVLVRLNFRLGVLGFLAAEALAQSVHPPTAGDYGLSDVLVALQWLHSNIQAFNGNNNSVTLLGHGAGATLVTALYVQPRARRLFSRAWVSGGSGVLPREGEGSGEAYERYVRSLPCGQDRPLACLRRLDARTLLERVPPEWSRPFERLDEPRHSWLVVDGVYLRDGFQDAWAAVEGLPVVVGAAALADVPSVEGPPEAWDADDGRLVRERLAGGPLAQWAEEVVRRYGATWRGYVSLMSDLRTVCPLAELARRQPRAAFYLANHTRPGDARADLDAILGVQAPGDEHFAAALQELFYGFARGSAGALETLYGEGGPQHRRGRDSVVVVGERAVRHSDLRHCPYWAARDAVRKFARRD